MKSGLLQILAAAVALGLAGAAQSGSLSRFNTPSNAGPVKVDFEGTAAGTTNPGYAGVSFAGFFAGQSVGNCAFAFPDALCVSGSPTSGQDLSLSPSIYSVSTVTTDTNNPGAGHILAGSGSNGDLFLGPIAVLFAADIAAVGFDAGFLDDVGSVDLAVYDRKGNLLGSATNSGTGVEFFGLATDSGKDEIAGLLLSFRRFEQSGYAIDNIRFARAADLPGGQAPEPGSVALIGLALASLGLTRRRKA